MTLLSSENHITIAIKDKEIQDAGKGNDDIPLFFPPEEFIPPKSQEKKKPENFYKNVISSNGNVKPQKPQKLYTSSKRMGLLFM